MLPAVGAPARPGRARRLQPRQPPARRPRPASPGSSTSATAATRRSRPTSPSALASLLRGRPAEDVFRIARIALDGFASRLPLEQLELELLGDLVAARLAAIVSISAWRPAASPRTPPTSRPGTTTPGACSSCSTGSARRRSRASSVAAASAASPALARRRNDALGALLTPLTYARPVHAVRAEGVWIHEPDGRRLLDAYNNVPVVGHCHPRVTEAVVRQTRLGATNARYLAEPLVELAERLLATLPAGGRPRHGAARQLRQRGERPRLAARRRRDRTRRRARDRERVPRSDRGDDGALARGLAVRASPAPTSPVSRRRERRRPGRRAGRRARELEGVSPRRSSTARS